MTLFPQPQSRVPGESVTQLIIVLNQTNFAEVSSATPINALTAVSLDTETTGLDTSSARLIQIGMINVSRGTINHQQKFESLVNPGIPIPPSSTKIHGLTDQDVKDERGFKDLKAEIENWIGNSIVIGFSIGFDLAILKRENELLNFEWVAPRSIDVRHLVKILGPQLPDYSLDTISGWLKISVNGRHQALGDAIITAEVFLALVPLLIEQGIRTLAQLEAACRLANNESVTESRAGWYDFLQSSNKEDITQHTLVRIDSFPYCHRVRDLMSSPPIIVDSSNSISQVLSIMMTNHVSCAFVRNANLISSHGIITERDILRAMDKNQSLVFNQTVREIARFPLGTIPESAFIYRAMGRMTRNNYRHLGVVDETGNIVGALTSRDLLTQRTEDVLNLGDAIEQAQNESDLSVVWANLALVATALDNENVDARDIAAVISRELCALTRRACQIAEREMAVLGMGAPPVPYAMILLGSGGRGESLLAMDQDNAIIYSDDVPEGNTESDIDQWFSELGTCVSKLLNVSGVPYCKGGIMGMNAEWRMSVSNWKKQIGIWITRTSPEDILKADIFFDMVLAHGDHLLLDEVYRFAFINGSDLSVTLSSGNSLERFPCCRSRPQQRR